jgi:hypothetical protein
MSNPNHAPAGGPTGGQFTSGESGEGASRQTMTQAHVFATRGNIRVKPPIHKALQSGNGGGGGGGGMGGGAIQQRGLTRRKLTGAARERVALNQDLDRRGSSGGGGQAMSEAGGESRRALSLATKRRR